MRHLLLLGVLLVFCRRWLRIYGRHPMEGIRGRHSRKICAATICRCVPTLAVALTRRNRKPEV